MDSLSQRQPSLTFLRVERHQPFFKRLIIILHMEKVSRASYLTLNIYLVGMLILEWMDELKYLPSYVKLLKNRGNAFTKELEKVVNKQIDTIFNNGEKEFHDMTKDYQLLVKTISTFDPEELNDYIAIAKSYKDNREEFMKHFKIIDNEGDK